jgi:hypothetical protein
MTQLDAATGLNFADGLWQRQGRPVMKGLEDTANVCPFQTRGVDASWRRFSDNSMYYTRQECRYMMTDIWHLLCPGGPHRSYSHMIGLPMWPWTSHQEARIAPATGVYRFVK